MSSVTKTQYTPTEGSYDVSREGSPIHHGFTRELGYKLYKMAVEGSPYDTGNLAFSIALRINTPTRILIRFPGDKVHYLELLEEGLAKHGKHDGFIKYGIFPRMATAVADNYLDRLSLPNSDFDRRKFLSDIAQARGFGTGRVTIGKSRFNKDTRAIRRQQSIRMARGG